MARTGTDSLGDCSGTLVVEVKKPEGRFLKLERTELAVVLLKIRSYRDLLIVAGVVVISCVFEFFKTTVPSSR